MFDDITDMLEQEYGCHSFVLYGSHANQSATASSDIDICAFRSGREEIRCCRKWNTHLLDVWIYPDTHLEESAVKYIRLRNGIILKEKNDTASQAIFIARRKYSEGPPEIPQWNLEVKRVWIEKTLSRIENDDPESNYRRAWLLCSLLENYFEFRKLWYLGPKESMTWLEQNDFEAFMRFSNSLTPGASLDDIRRCATVVLTPQW